jgi:CRP-like cAMP-binding protein
MRLEELGEVVAGCTRPVDFVTGEYLLRVGAPAEECFLIERGRVALEAHAPARPAEVIATLGAGDLVGLSWILPPYRWAYDARAMQPVHAIAIDARRVRERCDADPKIAYQLLQGLLRVTIDRLQAMRLQHLDLYREPVP